MSSTMYQKLSYRRTHRLLELAVTNDNLSIDLRMFAIWALREVLETEPWKKPYTGTRLNNPADDIDLHRHSINFLDDILPYVLPHPHEDHTIVFLPSQVTRRILSRNASRFNEDADPRSVTAQQCNGSSSQASRSSSVPKSSSQVPMQVIQPGAESSGADCMGSVGSGGISGGSG